MFKKLAIPFVLLLSALPFAGCNSASSGLNQSCSSSGDCKDGRLCISQVCVQNEFPVKATAKECVTYDCEKDADCCANFQEPSYCATYKTECDADPTSSYCRIYDLNCVCSKTCDTDTHKCVSPASKCTSDTDCPDFCNTTTGTCVECLAKTDCDTGEICNADGECESECTTDENCPLFYGCTKGTCVEKGCTSDRECILFSKRADATCAAKDDTHTSPYCKVPCTENAECGALQVCDNGECAFLGCETDDECRTYLNVANENSSSTSVAKCVSVTTTK